MFEPELADCPAGWSDNHLAPKSGRANIWRQMIGGAPRPLPGPTNERPH